MRRCGGAGAGMERRPRRIILFIKTKNTLKLLILYYNKIRKIK